MQSARSRLGGRLSVAAVAALLFVGVAGTAIATLWNSPAYDGSTFNAADGNLLTESSGVTVTPSPSGTPFEFKAKDWDKAAADYGGLDCVNDLEVGVPQVDERLNCGIDKTTGSGDDSFGQGTKEDTEIPSPVTGSIPNNKSDLTRFYVAKEHAASGDDYLYLAWERVQEPSGTTNMDFEFNQARPAAGAGNGITPLRTAGDLLIKFDLSQGGVNPQLGYHEWITTETADEQCEAASAAPCWGPLHSLDGAFEGSVNTVAVPDPILAPLQPATPVRMLSARTFGEAAVNLTDSGVLSEGCRSFGSAYVKSRSSDSFTAALKDYIAPIPVNIDNCAPALIKIRKYSVTGTGGSSATASPSAVPAPTSSPTGGALLGGAKFKVYKDRSAGSTTGDGVYTAADAVNPLPYGDPPGSNSECETSASDGIGTCVFKLPGSLASNGRYWIVETTAPNGYQPAPVQFVDVTIGQTAVTYTVELSNSQAPGDIRVEKVDDAGAPVVGAKLRLFGSDGTTQVGSDCTTDADGVCVFSSLPWGVYFVGEVSAPAGYGLAPTAAATVSAGPSPGTGQTIRLTMIDPRLHRIIVIACHEGASKRLTSATVALAGVPTASGAPTPVTTLSAVTAVPSPLASAGVTGAQLCELGGASFNGLRHGTYSPTVVLPTPTSTSGH